MHNMQSDIHTNIVELFKKIIEDDLKTLAIKISRERDIPIDTLLPYISIILKTPMIEKIHEKHLDISSIKYKTELQRYTLKDLREIAKNNHIAVSGTRAELIERISGACDFTLDEILKVKSFTYNAGKSRPRKKTVDAKVDATVANLVDDSDEDID
jgi:hypothetical protein